MVVSGVSGGAVGSATAASASAWAGRLLPGGRPADDDPVWPWCLVVGAAGAAGAIAGGVSTGVSVCLSVCLLGRERG